MRRVVVVVVVGIKVPLLLVNLFCFPNTHDKDDDEIEEDSSYNGVSVLSFSATCVGIKKILRICRRGMGWPLFIVMEASKSEKEK